MKTFAVPDLHGRYDLLERALGRIEGAEKGGTMVFLGDYIDRGPDGRAVVERLMAGPPAGWAWVALKGNHEDMMVAALMDNDIDLWLVNGGTATLRSYGGAVPAAHVAWCADLPVVHTDRHRVFVHAGIDPGRALDDQDAHEAMWRRYGPDEDVQFPGLHIVHGHTPNPDGPEFFPGRTNLDCLAFDTGRLTVGVFEDDTPGGPVDIMEVRGMPG